jgi:hypothetical protein
VPLCGVSVLSEMSGVPVDVVSAIYAGFDTMPEHALKPWQAAVIDEARLAHGLG